LEKPVFRSFFPAPRAFFLSAVGWTALAMLIWFAAGGALEHVLGLGPLLAVRPSATDPHPFFDPDRVWLYEYVLATGYLFCVPWYFYKRSRRWYWWSVVGSVTIIEFVYFDVQISAWLNNWYNQFYDLIQNAIAHPNTITLNQYLGFIWTVALVLIADITGAVLNLFLTSHYLFRWRRAMSFYYMANWQDVRVIEGASQRVQEDTQQFSSIVESLGITFVNSVMTLIVFLPILWGLSQHVTVLPWIGHVDASLVWIAIISAAFGTVLLGVVGIRLPHLTFQNQLVEAAFRKELVLGEDYAERAQPPTIRELFINMQRNYYRLYFNYLYFNVARYAYLQGSAFVPYIAMGPAVVTGALTFGLFQQVLDAFGQVSDSFRFLVNSWTSIISLISIYQRLRGFEARMPANPVYANDYDDPAFLNSVDHQEAAPATP
jgi:peptide/bleomycin uptake transporter